jgi:hypothetical protein
MPKETSKRNRAAIQLTSGRTIEVIAIDQSYTYEGLLLGVPTTSMNQAMMDRLRMRYVRPGEYGVPLLLEPEQRPIDVPSHVQRMDTPAELPAVTCIARLMSDGLAGTDDIWSVLRVIWFQDDFAFPIAERVLRQIAEIDWEAHATSWEP